MFSLTNSEPSALLFNGTFFIEAFLEKKTHTHISIQQYSLTICMHDVEHDLKYSVFKVVVYVKYEFNFSGLQIYYWSVIGWLVIGG